MILIDANLLIYAVNRDAFHHKAARRWFEETLSGGERVGLPWICLLAFLRLTTRPGVLANPLTIDQATGFVYGSLKQPFVEPIVPARDIGLFFASCSMQPVLAETGLRMCTWPRWPSSAAPPFTPPTTTFNASRGSIT